MRGLEVPDKGYAWVIVFCAAVINTIVSGLSRMVGLLYVAILEEYTVQRREASLPFTVRNAIRYLTGPLVGVLGQKYGIRSVTFVGGLIAAAGSIFSAFAPSVTWIVILWGGIHGLGFSMSNTLFQVVVNQYFEHHRATASGIVLSGACVGSLFYPFMIGAMLDAYGLFGCFLLLGGLFLNILPPSLGLKPPIWVRDPEGYARKKALYENLHGSTKTLITDKNAKQNTVSQYLNSVRSSIESCGMPHLDSTLYFSKPKTDLNSKWSRKFKLNESRKCEGQFQPICTLYTITEDAFLGKSHSSQNVLNATCRVPKQSNAVSSSDNDLKLNIETTLANIKTSKVIAELPSADTTSKPTLLDEIKSIFRLYSNVIYVLISVSMATYMWLFIPILTVIVDYSRDKGIPLAHENYLIHSLTIGDLIGRVAFGWVTDRNFVSLHVFMCLSFVLQGTFSVLFPFSNYLIAFIAMVALYGVTAGTIFAHFPVVVHRYVDERNQNVAMCCIGVVSGMISFGIPPFIGYFRDNIGSYDGLFYTVGVMSAINGTLWLLVPLLEQFANKQPTKS